jgi:hypothetical protein
VHARTHAQRLVFVISLLKATRVTRRASAVTSSRVKGQPQAPICELIMHRLLFFPLGMGAWQGMAMDSLKFSSRSTMRDPSTPCWRTTLETALQPVAVFCPFGHPTPYAYGSRKKRRTDNDGAIMDTGHGREARVTEKEHVKRRKKCKTTRRKHVRMGRGGPGQPCQTLLCPEGGPPLKQPNGCSWGGLPVGLAACGRILPFWIPHAIRP